MKFRDLPWYGKLAFLFGAAWATCYSDKPGGYGRRILEFAWVTRDGRVHPAGAFAPHDALTPIVETLAMALQEAGNATATAGEAIAQAEELAALLDHGTEPTRYYALSLPRATPERPDVNVAITLERVVQHADRIEAWYWFSAPSTAAVDIHLDAAIAEDAWASLRPLTNEWPHTETINGVPCVRYEYELPPALSGVVLIPPQDVAFGGPDGQPFVFPPDGVDITDEHGVHWVGATVTDTYEDEAGNVLELIHEGGLLVAAKLNGVEL